MGWSNERGVGRSGNRMRMLELIEPRLLPLEESLGRYTEFETLLAVRAVESLV